MEGVIDDIKNKILELLEVDAIVLFGSFARNTYNKESDIDIAIKPKNKITKKRMFDIMLELSDIANRDIDLINLNEINDDFRYEILFNGITLYCENELEFELYKLRRYRDYMDLNDGRKIIIDRILNGGTIYGE